MTKMYSCDYISPVGVLKITGDDQYLTGISYRESEWNREEIRVNYSEDIFLTDNNFQVNSKVLTETIAWLENYFAGRIPQKKPPVKYDGSEFAREVYRILEQIPYGETITYGEIADQIARKRGGRMSAQAVGNAVGKNPIAIMIPCHRVMGKNGKLTGYHGGIKRKEYLLEIENVRKGFLFPVP